ncbi:MAG: hypothetical protein FWD29_00945 [Micrococcales bacterium]|nr:hypothetical protein [Micrococcales bacterium]
MSSARRLRAIVGLVAAALVMTGVGGCAQGGGKNAADDETVALAFGDRQFTVAEVKQATDQINAFTRAVARQYGEPVVKDQIHVATKSRNEALAGSSWGEVDQQNKVLDENMDLLRAMRTGTGNPAQVMTPLTARGAVHMLGWFCYLQVILPMAGTPMPVFDMPQLVLYLTGLPEESVDMDALPKLDDTALYIMTGRMFVWAYATGQTQSPAGLFGPEVDDEIIAEVKLAPEYGTFGLDPGASLDPTGEFPWLVPFAEQVAEPAP